MFAKFEYTAPATVEELLGILAQEKAGTVIYGGGTDVIVDLRSEKLQAERLIDIKTIPELRRITEKKDCICVGCAATLTQIHDDPLVNRYAPTVAQGCGQVGSVQIRNKGTLAGNIQTASPAGDGLNGAMAADAVAVLQSVSGQRRVPLTEYIVGPRKTQRKNDEFLAYIEIPKKEMTFAEFFKAAEWWRTAASWWERLRPRRFAWCRRRKYCGAKSSRRSWRRKSASWFRPRCILFPTSVPVQSTVGIWPAQWSSGCWTRPWRAERW